MKKYILPALLMFLALSLTSCKEKEPGQNVKKKKAKTSARNIALPNIAGAAGEVLVVMDNFHWKNNSGELLRQTLEQEYPTLTQAEPLFDITRITSGAFDDLFRMHRTIIQVNVEDNIEKSSIRYGENLWAKPQLVIRMEAKNSYDLEELLKKESETMLQNILIYDRKRLQDIYAESKDQEIRNLVAKFNVSLAIPRGYNIDFGNDEFASISIETPKTSQVVFVYQYDYKGEKDFETNNIIKRRNAFLKQYTVGTRLDSYLTTAPLFPPLSYDIKKNGMEIVEVRGWWELHNGYMGGPFISHSVLDTKRNKVVVVEGYVYNPNNKKRNMMRQLETIIYSLEFLSS